MRAMHADFDAQNLAGILPLLTKGQASPNND